jgi:hypothetical protein
MTPRTLPKSIRTFVPIQAIALIAFAACSGNGGNVITGAVAPSVQSNTPVSHSTGVPVNALVSARFSEAMDSSTLTETTFLLTSGPAFTPVVGTVIYGNRQATFLPSAHLANDTMFHATITRDAHNFFGIALPAEHNWDFTTGSSVDPGIGVSLGSAGTFAILAKAAISTVPTSAITGNLGISPAAATFITGFALTADPTNVFSTSAQVTGKVYAADYAVPTPAELSTAVLDMQRAFLDAAGRAPDSTELGAGNIGGMTLAPGVYRWSTGLLIPTDLTLNGSATDVWIFQIAQNLEMASATTITMSGGSLPKNVFWQVSGTVDIGTTASFRGNVLGATGITLRTGATVHGRLLAQTAVSLDGNTIVEPVQ